MGKPGTTGAHDVGGVVGTDKMGGSDPVGPIDRLEKDYKLWERETHALMLALVRKGLLTVDELRRGVEGLPPVTMETMSYYERWASSITAICVERRTITQDEFEAQLGPKDEVPTQAKFAKGDFVRVRDENAAVRWRKPHLRTPGYIHGLVGVIERDCQGLFLNPENLAFNQKGAAVPMYRVRFAQADVWEGYSGGDDDSVDVEIYEGWLQPATSQELDAQRAQRAARQAVFHAHHEHQDKKQKHDHHHEHEHEHHGLDHHEHEHGHGHSHDGGEPHVHEARSAVEQAAVDKEGEEDAERRRIPEAIKRTLILKNLVTADELRQGVEELDSRGVSGAGARLVARAWVDQDFKERLIKDGNAACAELGIPASVYPSAPVDKTKEATATVSAPAAPTPLAAQDAGTLPVRHGTLLTVVEDTPEVHNVLVCTLCSCYPLAVLGMSPGWYKSRQYRARMVRDPRGVLREFGTILPDDVAVHVHDSTADNRYMVLPLRPAGTEEWSEEQLRALVTRDTMIGVAIPRVPTTN